MQPAEPVIDGVLEANELRDVVGLPGVAVGNDQNSTGAAAEVNDELAGQAVGIAPGAFGFVVGEGEPIVGEAIPVAYPPQVLPPGQDQRLGAQGGQVAYGTLVLHAVNSMPQQPQDQ